MELEKDNETQQMVPEKIEIKKKGSKPVRPYAKQALLAHLRAKAADSLETNLKRLASNDSTPPPKMVFAFPTITKVDKRPFSIKQYFPKPFDHPLPHC